MGPQGNYQLWVSSVDQHGKEIHPEVIQAAEGIGNGFFNYRRGDIQCESVASGIVQNTVEFTSRVHRRTPIDDLPRYIRGAYRNNVDTFLRRQSRISLVGSDRLERAGAHYAARCREVDQIIGRILLREIVEMMTPEARAVFRARLAGYSMDHIAERLEVSRHYMPGRYYRGLQQAVAHAMPEWPIKFGHANKGGNCGSINLSKERRSELARRMNEIRWGKKVAS